jgi:hypothetical protein
MEEIVAASQAREEQLRQVLRESQEMNTRMMAQVRRLTRRQSGMVVPPATPFVSPPRVSSTTHSTYASIQTPAGRARQVTRISLGAGVSDAHAHTLDEVDSDSEEAKEALLHEEEEEEVVDPKDVAQLAKIMAKVKVPKTFSGATEDEREGVQAWANDLSNYLLGQFGQLQRRYPEREWTVASPLFEGTARMWVDNARLMTPHISWEELKPAFIAFIRGGRESRAVQAEKITKLVYGQGKCKDLLSLEREFEELRMRLYPSSSTSIEMNEIVGKWYAEAIARGDPELYRTTVLILGANDQPTLSEWKSAAARAVQMGLVEAAARRGKHQFQRAGGNWHRGQGRDNVAVRVNELEGVEGEGEETDDNPGAGVNQMHGRRGRPGGPKPDLVDDEDWKRVLDKKLCWQCYKPGHFRGDDACKEKGKQRRKPTAEELKVIKA